MPAAADFIDLWILAASEKQQASVKLQRTPRRCEPVLKLADRQGSALHGSHVLFQLIKQMYTPSCLANFMQISTFIMSRLCSN